MLHGIYCDPKKKEHARITAFTICNEFAEQFTPGIISELVNQHEGYRAKGDESRAKASRGFFESLALLGLLSESERHSMISAACKDLMTVHYAMNNFYNERPFAERLASLSRGHQVPQTVQEEFVEAIATCSVGNEYGTAHTADPIYVRMIQGFSRREVVILLSLPEQRTVVGSHIKSAPRCKAKFREIVGLLQVESVPTKMKSTYENWLQV